MRCLTGYLRKIFAWPKPCGQKGSALVVALMLLIVVVYLVSVGGQLIVTSYKETKTQQNVVAESDNVARAGLVDALAWFKRQSQQPVSSGVPPGYKTGYSWVDGAFYPRYNIDRTKCDTIDESIGLVKEYQLSLDGAKWARYEVRRQGDPATHPYEARSAHDVTSQRIFNRQDGEGYVWYLESFGYVYMNRNPDAAFNVSPNKIIATARSSTEIRRLTLTLPAECAVIVKNGGSGSAYSVAVNHNGKIDGGPHYGSGKYTGNCPATYDNGQVTGLAGTCASITDDPTPFFVLGVSTAELRMMADYLVTSVSSLPNPLPDMSLIYVDGNAVFSSTQPLRSSGVLFVNGNLTLSAGSNSLFSGLIYVTGAALIYDPVLLSGTLIAYGGVTVSRSSAVDVAEVDYDSSILNSVRQIICQYRENKSAYRSFIGVPGMN